MSYQLPDLLTILNSLTGEEEDGDLHINPSYQAASTVSLTWLLANLRLLEEPMKRTSRLEKTTEEFLNEYNPGLLASVYLPFSSVPNHAPSPSALQVATEWLAICAVVTEQIARPLRVVDFEVPSPKQKRSIPSMADWLSQPVWQCILPHINLFCPPESKSAMQRSIEELLNAQLHPPRKPTPPPRHSSVSPLITEYLEWRATVGGLRVLSEIVFPFEDRVRIQPVLSLALEIIACVTDLFAYNIHQAWHLRSGSDHNHLNLVAFILAADPELVLQGAINQVGEMIRERLSRLGIELEEFRNNKVDETSKEPRGVFASLLSSFYPSSSSPQDSAIAGIVPNPNQNGGRSSDIQQKLLNWVTGTIHWAYEVEYFFPVEDETQHTSGTRRKRGGEIRDYGWIFLLKGEDVGGPPA